MRTYASLIGVAAASLVAAVAIGCSGGDTAESRVASADDVAAAFEDADLPIVESFADVGSCKEDPSDLDLDEPDEPGVQIIDMNCTFTFVQEESGERPPTLFHAREYSSGRPEFYVAVYATVEEAVLAEATGVQVGANADDGPRNVIRVSNVLAVVQPVDDALTEQIRDTLEDL